MKITLLVRSSSIELKNYIFDGSEVMFNLDYYAGRAAIMQLKTISNVLVI